MACVAGGKSLKKVAPMIAASEPYRKKSYYSKTVPSEEAKITLRSSRVIRPADEVRATRVVVIGCSLRCC